MHPNTTARLKLAAAVAAVLALSAPAALGVYRSLEVTRGSVAAGLAAAGIELCYLSLSVLALRPELRPQARAVALGAVVTSVSLNVLADYSARVPGGLASWPRALAAFDPLGLALALVESAPLAILAFSLASLLHRLAENAGPAEQEGHTAPPAAALPDLALARVEPYPAPELVEDAPDARQESIAPHRCPRCDAPLDRARFLAAKRWGHCASCKGGA